jgi:hypothetical protein
MSEFEPKYLVAVPAISSIDQADHVTEDDDIRNVSALRYSSAWPWICAVNLGITMWALLVWLVSRFF